MSGCPCCSCSDAEFVHEREATKPCHECISESVRWIKCRGCGLVRRANPPAPADLQRYYQAEGANDKPPSGQALHSKLVFNDRLWQRACSCFGDDRPETALEIGSSWGEFCSVLNYHGVQTIGIEASGMRAKWAENTLGVRTLTGDALDLLPTIGADYDAIALWEVLEHFPDPGHVLRLVRSALNPRWLMLSTPCLDHPYHRAVGANDPMWGVPEHLVYFDRKTLGAVLRGGGFSVVASWFSASHLGCTRWVARAN